MSEAPDCKDAAREDADRPRFWTRGMIVACSALGLVVLLFLLWLLANYTARKAVERELADIRARGEPVTFEEAAPPPVPDDENAAVVFELAFAELDACVSRLEADPDLQDWETFLYEPVVPQIERYERVLGELAEPVRLTREALGRSRCRFDLDYSAWSGMEFPHHLAKLRRLARIFRHEAMLRVHDGRATEAAGSTATILRLSQMLEEPVFISWLVRMAVVGIGLDALESVEERVHLPDESRRRLMEELARSTVSSRLAKIFVAERACFSDSLEGLFSGETDLSGIGYPKIPGLTRIFRFHFRRDHARYLQMMTEFVDATRLPLWEAVTQTEAITDRVEALPAWQAPLTRLGVPVLSAGVVRFARMEARRGAATLALAADLYHSAHERYPDSLDELVPAILPGLPPDPFTGRPFIYRLTHEGEGFVVYSIGENLADDGGVFDRWERGDIPWERKPPEEEADARPAEGGTGRDSRER